MARKYKYLTYADRKKIETMIKEGISSAKIAEAIGVHSGTIYREIKAGGGRQNYNAQKVQSMLVEKMLS